MIRTPIAEVDLQEILYYISVEEARPETAKLVAADLLRDCEKYAQTPNIGLAVTTGQSGIRYFVHKRWVVIYRPIAEGIEVIRIVDGARDFRNIFGRL